MIDDAPISPGRIVRSAMNQKGWSQSDLAFALGTSTASINQILSDKRSKNSHNMARALGAALGLPGRKISPKRRQCGIWPAQKGARFFCKDAPLQNFIALPPSRYHIKREIDRPRRMVQKHLSSRFAVSFSFVLGRGAAFAAFREKDRV